ncbi:hypothetical protein Pst134EB_006571 [Puccinia striiformis f. sp. tritici]|nr:hypothetical protein Pst134EB_006571 [Puccinia striiformis f. sp. tritici]
MLANNSTAGHLKISSVEVAFVAAIFSSQLRSQSQAKSSPGYSHLSSGSIKKSLVSNLLRLKDQPLRSPLFSKDYRNMINFRSNGTLLSVLWVMAITAGFALGASVLGRDGPRKGCIEQLHCKGSNE